MDPDCLAKLESQVYVLPHSLEPLIRSAKMYPPAWVFALREARSEGQDCKSFCTALARSIRARMSTQRSDPYFLAEALESDGDIAKGHYYWIINVRRKTEEVQFISTDYHWYWYSKDSFRIPEEAYNLEW